MVLRGPDEIAMAAWREAITRMSEGLSPEVRAAFDIVWPNGVQSAEEARVLIHALQRALHLMAGHPARAVQNPEGVGWHRHCRAFVPLSAIGPILAGYEPERFDFCPLCDETPTALIARDRSA